MNLEKNKGLIIGLGIFLLLLISSTAFTCSVLLDNTIHNDISINNVDVSGLTKDEAVQKLSAIEDNFNKLIIPVYFKDKQIEITPSDIDAKLDIQKSVDAAYKLGREGSIIERFSQISNLKSDNRNLSIEVSFDKNKLLKHTFSLTKGYNKDEVEPTYSIKGNKLVIKSGSTANVVDQEKLVNDIKDSLSKQNISPVDIKIATKKPETINVEEVYEKVHSEPVDASYKEDGKKFTVIPHKIGIDFDILEAKSVVESVYTENQEVQIPLTIKEPKISTKMLLDSLFSDTLANFSTRYNPGDAQRAENLRVATKSINGKILLPGEEFSYNETLGPRTIENGYKEAHVYSKGKVIAGLGGGICQVSTTLYNTSLLADIEILQRRNHNMTVPYVKPGTDATVSYGSVDFRFRNNKDFPIKLLASAAGGKVNISILGTSHEKNKTIEITTEVLSTKDPVQTIVEDPTMPEGSTKVVQKGQKGYVVKVYKVTKVDGVKVSAKMISKDTYIPMENIIKKGTKKAAVKPTVTPKPTTEPEPTAAPIEEPVDDSQRPDGI